jgi:hypothetical protein
MRGLILHVLGPMEVCTRSRAMRSLPDPGEWRHRQNPAEPVASVYL